MEFFLTTYLKTECVDGKYTVHLFNGAEVPVEKEVVSPDGTVWLWKVESQYFDTDDSAMRYLKRLIAEKLTGKRVIFHQKQAIPDICGKDGRGCRHPGKCNSLLCWECPIAEQFCACRDGVELVYAV